MDRWQGVGAGFVPAPGDPFYDDLRAALAAKTHVNRTMIKLGARDRAQLAVYAYEAGLIRPGWLD